MESLLQPPQPQQDTGNGNGMEGNGLNGVLYVKVMTDEQLEILRTQIAVYTSLCHQLVDMYKAFTTQQDLTGVRLGNFYCDSLITAVGHKINARQRWTPTPMQLQILERIFEQGTGTPSKQKIKEITAELSQHGQISETNVYNWFQNRRARSKRKQLSNAQNNAESEAEIDAESPKDKKTGPENFQGQSNSTPRADDPCFQNQEPNSTMHSMDSQSGKVEPVQSVNQMAFYESILQNPGIDHLIGKMEVFGSFDDYPPAEDFSMIG